MLHEPPHRLAESADSSMEPQGRAAQREVIEALFTRPPIFEGIFSHLSPATFIRFSRTCKLARESAAIFSDHAFNINRHLSRFFSDPLSFRSLQAKTATLISGSSVLQFLERTFYPESDLDLYTHPGEAREVGLWLMKHEGYTFVPKHDQGPDFEDLDWADASSWMPWDLVVPRQDVRWDDLHVDRYRISGLDEIYCFEKRQSGEPDAPPLRLQIMSSEYTPLQCVFGFHSTCVMNFIAFDAAYSIFPRATFEEHRSLSFSGLTDSDVRALGKYTMRGWATLSNLWPYQYHTLGASFYVNKIRFVDDSLSWVVPLDTTGMKPRPRLSASSPALAGDPVVHNSWKVARDTKTSKVYMTYNIFRPTLFRYAYLVADPELIYKTMSEWLFQQGSLEHKKRRAIPEGFQASSWTWWDGIFSEFIKLHQAAPPN